tara:strand:- start:518 stop:1174 length:657 start_codon:yes stop_codon:yes gene_type:complete
MAAGQGYIEFSTGDVLTATAANGYLASQVVMVFAGSTARGTAITSPEEGMFSYLKDTNSTEYYDGSAWTAIGGGGGGKVLQVVQGTLSSNTVTTSAVYVDSGLTVTITPTLATSKIQVIAMLQSAYPTDTAGGSNCLAEFNLVRNSTQIQNTIVGTGSLSFGGGYKPRYQVSFSYLDSPATTSATTYKIQMKRNTGSSVGFDGSATAINSIVVMEIGA